MNQQYCYFSILVASLAHYSVAVNTVSTTTVVYWLLSRPLRAYDVFAVVSLAAMLVQDILLACLYRD
jgi:hypothetical protein